MTKDYYSILGVDKSASKDEIKKAYKKLAKKYHPDISKESDAEIKFKDINEAAGILLDDEKKQRYDTYGSAEGPQGFGGGGFNPGDFGINLDDIFEQFGFGSGGGFGGFGGRSGQKNRKSKRDVSLYEEIEITLDDVYFGIEKELDISREDKCDTCNGKGAKNANDISTCSTCNGSGQIFETKQSLLGMIRTQRPCPTCHGEGESIKNPCSNCDGLGSERKREKVSIKIPKGIENGVTLRVNGKGNYDRELKDYGDLYLKVYIKSSKDYEVDGSDLYKTLDINFVQAILGDEIEFKHFDKTLSLKIPSGTQAGSILRLKSKGLPHFNYTSNGDLYVKINVEIPTKTTTKQKEILLDYAKTLKDKSMLDRLKGLFK